jgi:hypothetical protein
MIRSESGVNYTERWLKSGIYLTTVTGLKKGTLLPNNTLCTITTSSTIYYPFQKEERT